MAKSSLAIQLLGMVFADDASYSLDKVALFFRTTVKKYCVTLTIQNFSANEIDAHP